MDSIDAPKALQGVSFLLWLIPLVYFLTKTPRTFYGFNVVPGKVQNYLIISAALVNVCHSYTEPVAFVLAFQLLGLVTVYAAHKNLRAGGLALSTRGMIRGEYSAEEIIEGMKLRGAYAAVGKQEVPYQFRLTDRDKVVRTRVRLCGTIVGLSLLVVGAFCVSEFDGWLALFNLGLITLYGAWSKVLYPISALHPPGTEE